MVDMLTAKDIQALLQVDRSTIYRMAETKRIPAVKVGRQWRFPADQVETWLQQQAIASAPAAVSTENGRPAELAALLPLDCVQLIQDSFAEALGVMIVVTDMAGNPVTKVSKPCGPFEAIRHLPNALQMCIEDWAGMGEIIDLEPTFIRSHLGLLGSRGLIRVGRELAGMVVMGGIAPDNWPPAAEEIAELAAGFGISTETLAPHINEVFYLNEAQKALTLALVQRIANIVAHIITERKLLLGKLESIAKLVNI